MTISFGLLLSGFLSKSHNPWLIFKPWYHSSLHNYLRFPAYVSTSYHIDLSKMDKHWGSFLSHCITSYIISTFTILVIIAIYGNQNKSYDWINNIFELNLKNGSEPYITSLYSVMIYMIPILEILCHGPNNKWMNQWINESINQSINQSKNSLFPGMIKNNS